MTIVEKLAREMYKEYGYVELSTQRKVEWWELSPTTKKYWIDIAQFAFKQLRDLTK